MKCNVMVALFLNYFTVRAWQVWIGVTTEYQGALGSGGGSGGGGGLVHTDYWT